MEHIYKHKLMHSVPRILPNILTEAEKISAIWSFHYRYFSFNFAGVDGQKGLIYICNSSRMIKCYKKIKMMLKEKLYIYLTGIVSIIKNQADGIKHMGYGFNPLLKLILDH